MVKLYSDILDSYPGVLGFVDPLHQSDVQGWLELFQRLGTRCLLVADKTLGELPVKTNPPGTKGGEDMACPTGDEADGGGDNGDPPPPPPPPSTLSYLSCATMVLDSTITVTLNEVQRLKGEGEHW